MASFPIIDAWATPAQPSVLDVMPEVERLFRQSGADFSMLSRGLTPAETVALMDEAGVSQLCLCAWNRPGKIVISNEAIAKYTRAYPDRFIGIASVDLLDPLGAVRELRKYVKEEGFKALRIVPWLWNLPMNDKHYWPLFVECIELDIPFMTQVGHTGPLCPSEVGRPIPYVDEIALKFPTLRIICGHIGYPWTNEMIGVAWKHENVFIDTSAYLPKYYPPELIQFANTIGRKKVMFGSNFPQLSWKKCVEQAKELKLREEVKADFFGLNVQRVLKLETNSKRDGKL